VQVFAETEPIANFCGDFGKVAAKPKQLRRQEIGMQKATCSGMVIAFVQSSLQFFSFPCASAISPKQKRRYSVSFLVNSQNAMPDSAESDGSNAFCFGTQLL
jgi:hypothetical protein